MKNIFSKVAFNAILGASLISQKPAQATTYFDITVYGDKELKIATVNKLKQKLRNAILQDISIAPDFLKLAINDALGFDASTLDGGADGSIQFELSRTENTGLVKAFNILQNVKKELQRTNVCTMGDVIAFAGSEALEAVGSDRIIVQVGRFDANKENKKSKIVPWDDLSDISKVKDAFLSSGLEIRDIAVLLASIGEVQRIVDETIQQRENSKNQSDDDDEPFEEEPFVPMTFGTRDAIYGEKVGKADFSSKYLSTIVKSGAKNSLDRVLLDDPQLKSLILRYVGNDRGFATDLAECYLRLSSIGKAFTNRNS